MTKIVLLAPIFNSLYARLVAFGLAKEKGIEINAIIVRSHWNIQRIRSEFDRDGVRKLYKIYNKLLVGDKRYSNIETSNLAALAQEWRLPYKSLKELARKFNIPYKVVSNLNHLKSVEFVKRIDPDIILFTGGGLLRQPILDIPRKGVLNCHTGILPQYRGMDVVEWTAIEKNIDTVGYGATLHFMDRGVDTGPILLKKTITPKIESSYAIIRAELEVLMVQLMIDGVKGLNAETIVAQSQELGDGRQYFVMHPRVIAAAEALLGKTN